MTDRTLQEFVQQINGTGHLRVEYDFGGGFVRLQMSEAERRQAIQDIQCSEHIVLELLRNARDAHASHIFVASSRTDTKRVFTVIDDGEGIPKSMHGHIFEPRVTSKLDSSHKDAWGLHGRGMALYSISVNSESAYVASSEPQLGTSIRVVSDTTTLTERADQSSFPKFEMAEAGKVNVRGPRNILRTVCEFAIECRSSCSVYIGSPAEICASLYQYGSKTLTTVERLFCKDVEGLMLIKRLAACATPREFAQQAGKLGLEISERSARRIIDGDISPAQPVLDRISIYEAPKVAARPRPHDALSDRRSFHLCSDDKQLLVFSLEEAYKTIAAKYYLEPDVKPQVRVSRDKILISIPIEKLP